MTIISTEIGRGWKEPVLVSKLFGKYLRRGVADILRVTCEAVRDMHNAKFGTDGTRDEERKAACGSSESTATLLQWILSAEMLY